MLTITQKELSPCLMANFQGVGPKTKFFNFTRRKINIYWKNIFKSDVIKREFLLL